MLAIIKYKNSLLMLGFLLFLLACIPREEPEKRLVLEQIGALPSILSENSGLTEAGGLVWFINDGGNEPALYGYKPEEDSVMRTVVIKNTENTDWEDIAQYENFIYIGDFGNNTGSRTDLRIVKINSADLLGGKDTINATGIIEFSYEDQTDFTPSNQATPTTPFDCEAFVATDDSLILFTKNWQNLTTRLYTLPVTPGVHVAKFRKEWNADGLITAAAWSSNKNELLLLGYSPILLPFVLIFNDFTPNNLTYSDATRTVFSDYFGKQTEGIMYSGNGSILISAEGNPPTWFKLDWKF